MVIGRLHHVIVDCPDPAALAAFYSELLGLPVTWQEDDFAVVSANDTTSGIGFQLAPDFQPPQWPDPARPQQMHFDVMVDDVEAAEPRVLALGARPPARRGQPFTRLRRPGRASVLPDPPPPVGPADRAAAGDRRPAGRLALPRRRLPRPAIRAIECAHDGRIAASRGQRQPRPP